LTRATLEYAASGLPMLSGLRNWMLLDTDAPPSAFSE
jgi:hypothetical protein